MESRGGANLSLPFTRDRYSDICGLVDIGPTWPGIEGGDKSREFTLQHMIVIPLFSLTTK